MALASDGQTRDLVRLYFQKNGSLVQGASLNVRCASNVKAVDYNRDGVRDLEVVGCTGLEFFTRSGSTWTKRTSFTAKQYDDIGTAELGDVNGDGRPDLVGKGPYAIWIATQTANHTFAAEHDVQPACHGSGNNTAKEAFQYVAVGDVTGDRAADVVCAAEANSASAVSVYPASTANRSISAEPWYYASDDTPVQPVIADINKDGRNDVIVDHNYHSAIGIYRQQNNGTLLPEQFIGDLGVSPNLTYGGDGLAIADLDHNGKPDIAFGGNGGVSLISQY